MALKLVAFPCQSSIYISLRAGSQRQKTLTHPSAASSGGLAHDGPEVHQVRGKSGMTSFLTRSDSLTQCLWGKPDTRLLLFLYTMKLRVCIWSGISQSFVLHSGPRQQFYRQQEKQFRPSDGNYHKRLFKIWQRFITTVSRICRVPSWTVQESNPGVGEIFRTRQNRPWGPPSFLHKGFRVSFPPVKRPGCRVDQPPPSRVEVKESVDLYHYFPSWPSWLSLGWNLPLPKFITSHFRCPICPYADDCEWCEKLLLSNARSKNTFKCCDLLSYDVVCSSGSRLSEFEETCWFRLKTSLQQCWILFVFQDHKILPLKHPVW
jgi:hypothetical protein